MNKNSLILQLTAFVLVLFFGITSCTKDEDSNIPAEKEFVGSQKCGECHSDHYSRFMESGHPYKISKITDGKKPNIPYFYDFKEPKLPLIGGKQYTWNDVSYTIGGFMVKMRFIDKDGYIMTGSTAQWNPQDNTQSGYNTSIAYVPGAATNEKYTCGTCHTTGWKTVADGGKPHDNLPGMAGEFKYGGVHCEQCHGMGNVHVITKSKNDITLGNKECTPCHHRRNLITDATRLQQQVSGGWEMHRNQYEQINTNKHSKNGMTCTSCHDVHSSTRHDEKAKGMGVKKDCRTCHSGPKYDTKMHYNATCTDCHMPKTVKNAISFDKYRGDSPNHNFKINTDPTAKYLTTDATGTWANKDGKGSTLDFACYGCHMDADRNGGRTASTRSLQELSEKAKTFHK